MRTSIDFIHVDITCMCPSCNGQTIGCALITLVPPPNATLLHLAHTTILCTSILSHAPSQSTDDHRPTASSDVATSWTSIRFDSLTPPPFV